MEIAVLVFVVFIGIFFLPAPMFWALDRWERWWDRQIRG